MRELKNRNSTKTPFQSKTVYFFLLAIIYTIAEGMLANQTDNIVDLKNVNWGVMITAVGGLILRFLTNKPIKP